MNDLRFAFGQFTKAPGFTAIIVLTLALGIGACTAVYSALDSIVLHPYDDPATARNVYLRAIRLPQRADAAGLSFQDFQELEMRATSFEFMAYHTGSDYVTLTGMGEPLRLRGAKVTPRYFDMFGIKVARGRAFLPEEFAAGKDNVVILRHAFWQSMFGGAPDIVGRTLQLDSKPYTVVGVLSERFERTGSTYEMCFPRAANPQPRGARLSYASATARLRQGVTVDQAQHEIDGIAAGLAENYPQTNKGYGIQADPKRGGAQEETITRSIPILFGAAVSLILIACANIASLLLVRGIGRQRELSVRAALGASRARLIRQLLIESLLVALFGGAAGALVAQWALEFIRSFVPPSAGSLGRLAHLHLDGPVLAYALGLTVATALLFGLAPAWLSASTDLNEALRQGSRGSTEGRSRGRIRAALVVVEIAMAFTLLASSGLLIRSFLKLTDHDLGFDAQRTAYVLCRLTGENYAKPEQRRAFTQAFLARLQSAPGVAAAGTIRARPFDNPVVAGFEMEGGLAMLDAERPVTQRLQAVSPDYFRAMGIPLKHGRLFSDSDDAEGRSVAIVNQTLARRYFPNQDCIGKRIRIDREEWREIVGVVGDIAHHHGDEAQAQCYEPGTNFLNIVVRGHGNAALLPAIVKAQLRALDPNILPASWGTFDELSRRNLAMRRLTVHLFIAFAAIGVLIAAIGIYGVIAFSVSQRTAEIGIRMALGAQRHDVLNLILRQGAWLVGIGFAVGIAATFVAGRAIEAQLYNTSGHDPISLLGITLFFAAVAALACWLPARHATKVDPIVALRAE
jgi:putative ABC transport system permease protein